jgi:hypothetical protein
MARVTIEARGWTLRLLTVGAVVVSPRGGEFAYQHEADAWAAFRAATAVARSW